MKGVTQFLPIARRWGGEPSEGRWRGSLVPPNPSTMPLCAMVPLPSFAREELK